MRSSKPVSTPAKSLQAIGSGLEDIVKKLDPGFTLADGTFAAPEYKQIKTIIDNLDILLNAFGAISSHTYRIAKASTAALWAPTIDSASTKVKRNFRALQASPNLARISTSLKHLSESCKSLLTCYLEAGSKFVAALSAIKPQINEVIEQAEEINEVYEDKGALSAGWAIYKRLGGISGAKAKIAKLREAAPSRNELLSRLLKMMNRINDKLKEVYLAIDETEIIMGMPEGFIFENVNRILNYDRKKDSPLLSVDAILREVNALSRSILNYEFDIKDRYPYTLAILEQRKCFAYWTKTLPTAADLAGALSKPASWQYFCSQKGRDALHLLVNQYHIDGSLRKQFNSMVLKRDIDLKADKQFFDIGKKIISELHKQPSGTTLFTQAGIQALGTRVNSAENLMQTEKQLDEKKQLDAEGRLQVKLVALIDQRINELKSGLRECYFFCRPTKHAKIFLLNQVKQSLEFVGVTFPQTIHLVKQKYKNSHLLFEGRTGELMKDLERKSSSRSDIIQHINNEINRLEKKRIWFFRISYKTEIRQRITALQRFQHNMNIQGYTVRDAMMNLSSTDPLFALLLKAKERSLLKELRKIEKSIPDELKDKKLIPRFMK